MSQSIGSKIKAAESAAVEEVRENPERVATLATIEENPAEAIDAARLAKEYRERLNTKIHEEEHRAEEQIQEQTNQRQRNMTDGTMMGGLADREESDEPSERTNRASSSARTLWVVVFIIQLIFAAEALGFLEEWLGISIINTNTLPITIPLFVTISIWAFFLFKDPGIISHRSLKLLFGFLLLSAVYILIVPWGMKIIDTYISFGLLPLSQILSFVFYFIFPAWPLVVANLSGDPSLHRYTQYWLNGAILLLLFLFIFYFATSISTSDILSRGGTGDIVQATNVVEFISDKFADTLKNLLKSANFAGNIKNLLNATGIAYYTGMVDQNEKAPVGLYITNVRPQDKFSYVGSPAVVWADIEGKSFTEVMKITPYCYTDGSGNKRTFGEASPSSLEIFGEEHDSIRCTFENLPKGTYKTIAGAGFNFETWAYTTYTFVDLELSRGLALEGKNINSELDIPRTTQAVYSNGPISLGMGASVEQPIRVDKIKNDRDPIVGVTLDNKWTGGHLERVNEFILQVPDDFELVDCDRGNSKPASFETKDGISSYRFSREELADPRMAFLSLTCRAHIKDPQKFLAGQQKVQRTFATQVKYDYYIEKSTSLNVKE